MSYRDIDEALDFANLYQRQYPFCRQMVRYFEVFGRLSNKQVAALLRIKAEHNRKNRGH